MASSTASATPQGEVDGLIQEVADEHGLEVAGSIQSAPQGEVAGGCRACPPASLRLLTPPCSLPASRGPGARGASGGRPRQPPRCAAQVGPRLAN